MALTSPLFLSVFLPLVTAGLFLLRKSKNTWLLLCSCVFFAFSADLTSPAFLAVPLLALSAFFLPRLGRKGAAFYTALALLTLLAFKLLPVAWPMGLSFVALQGISYALDTTGGVAPRGKREISAADAAGCGAAQKGQKQNARVITACAPASSLKDGLLYTLFFPKLAAGPLCRFPNFIEALRGAGVTLDGLDAGLKLLTIGLSKKLLIADRLLPLAKGAFEAPAHPLASLLALIACPLYVYYDFSGYTDMARGAAKMLGISLPQNFDRPFSARSLRDFWRRWHITLSAFLRTYVYFPLGGSRVSNARTALNLLAVFLLMGAWHGLTAPYLCFGLWHGALLALEHLGVLKPDKWPRPLARLYTLLCVAVGFVLFLSPSLGAAFNALGARDTSFLALQAALAPLSPLTLAALALAAALPCVRLAAPARGARRALMDAAFFLLLIVCYMEALTNGYSPFLYAQF